MASLFAGTSGFAYPEWKPDFYPAKLPAARFLEHYASRLNCVEINYTFRRTPSEATVEGWINGTPPGFVFAVKAHQRITHVKRLKDAQEPTEFFLKALEPLRSAGRLGPILFQLPPYLKRDIERLEDYLALLPPGLRTAIEFRDPSWFVDDVYEVLRRHNVALCVAESERLEVPEVLTADFVYFRLRKQEYSPVDIGHFIERSRQLLATGRDLYLIFKHENPRGALEAEEVLKAA